ncbi:MAG: DnaJ domain-containing protein [Candidatus Poseidoniales archaeon]
MAERDPYQVLGVSRGGGDAEIKKSFRKLARQFHPDRNDGSPAAEARFKEVQAAYDSIGTAEARRKQEQEQMFGARGGNPFGGTGGGAGMDDMFSEMFGGRARGGQRHRGAPQPPQEKGRNATAWLDITPEEAKQGGSFELTFTQLIPGSHGSIDRIRRTQNIKISPAVKHGKEIRVKGQGHGHPQGAKGDLIVNVRIDPGEGCIWDGGRIVKEVEVSYSTLALGGKVTVTLPSGVKGKITVPPLSQVGDRQRVKDIDIEFILAELDDLDESQKDALEALKGVGL